MNKKIETIANISLTIIGLSLGIIFYLTSNKELSLIMFSIALACILYQFLGGIGQGSSFQMGAIKFGGAAAILIGFMFFLKQFIFTSTEIQISDNDWLPISIETGKLKTVKIEYGNNKLVFPNQENYKEERKKHEYQLSHKSDKQLSIQLKTQPKETIGYVEINNIKSNKLFNTTESKTDELVKAFKLHPYDENKNSSKDLDVAKDLPFEITVNTSRFSIEPYFLNREVIKRSSFIIPVNEQEFYLVILEQANSNDKKKEKRYSKWIVKKLINKLQ